MVIAKTPFQSFRLDLSDVATCMGLISKGTTTRNGIAGEMGMGEKKVEGIFEWAEFLGLIEGRKRTANQELTALGRVLVQVQSFQTSRTALEILYANISANHPLVSRIVNSYVYEVSRSFDPIFDKDAFKAALLRIGQEFNVSPAFLSKRAGIYLDLLSNADDLGRLSLVVERTAGRYRVSPHSPAWQAAAYILYDSWPENVSRIRISEVMGAPNGLGRIFFLTEQQVMVLLSKLELERAIALEMVADLHQIGRNPAMKAQDFLEMLFNAGD